MPKSVKKIVILKNTHPSKSIKYYLDNNLPIPNELQDGYESCVKSQFFLATYIKNNPNKIYIYENNHALFPGIYNSIDDQARNLFPNDLPKKFSLLTQPQKDFLAYHGGVMLSIGKKIINQTYSDSRILLDKFQFYKKIGMASGISQNLKEESWKNLNKEYLVIDNAITTGNKLGEEEVFVIYGGGHLFTDLALCFPGIDIQVKDLESMVGSFLTEAKKQEGDEWNARPPVNCNFIHQQFFVPRLNNGHELQQSSSLDSNMVLGVIALLGLISFGLFKLAKYCWKSSQQEEHCKLKPN